MKTRELNCFKYLAAIAKIAAVDQSSGRAPENENEVSPCLANQMVNDLLMCQVKVDYRAS